MARLAGLVALAVGLGIALVSAPVLVTGGTLAVLVGLALLVVRLYWLPSIALAAFALIPMKLLPVPEALVVLNPALVVVLVWLVRRFVASADGLRAKGSSRLPWALPALACVLIVGVIQSPSLATSGGWAFSFVVLGIVPAYCLRGDSQARETLISTWVYLAVFLGAFAIMEAFFLHRNPLFDWAYTSSSHGFNQHWSVYRATTSLGHPLLNATFFAVAVPLAYGRWLANRNGRWVLAIAVPSVGVIATASRAGVGAMAAAAIAVALCSLRGSERGRWVPIALGALVVLFIAGIAGVGYVGERSDSTEGDVSFSYRYSSFLEGLDLAGNALVLGRGPGLAGEVKFGLGGIDRASAFENSWLELLVATGVPGLLLFSYVLFEGFRRSRRSNTPGVAGAIAAYAVMAGSFNLLEGHRGAHLMVGMIIGISLTSPKSEAESVKAQSLMGDSVARERRISARVMT
jgi:hypothetical protein